MHIYRVCCINAEGAPYWVNISAESKGAAGEAAALQNHQIDPQTDIELVADGDTGKSPLMSLGMASGFVAAGSLVIPMLWPVGIGLAIAALCLSRGRYGVTGLLLSIGVSAFWFAARR